MPSTDTRQVSATDKFIGLAAGGFAFVGGAGIVVLMLITLVGVFWRYALNNPIFGIGDLSVMTLTIVAACAVAFGATKQAHVSVNIITIFFGRNVTRFTDAAMRLAAIFITGLAAYALFSKACGFEKACITENLSLEHRNFYRFLGLGMAFYMIVFATHLVIGLRCFNSVDPNEPDE
ncbi:MAG: TRAP transporter small permease subunit [Alphaproteobacteria bacterium]|nr:TRAP transporter small permease subunit [Alphaproteobacteria bacterium]